MRMACIWAAARPKLALHGLLLIGWMGVVALGGAPVREVFVDPHADAATLRRLDGAGAAITVRTVHEAAASVRELLELLARQLAVAILCRDTTDTAQRARFAEDGKRHARRWGAPCRPSQTS